MDDADGGRKDDEDQRGMIVSCNCLCLKVIRF